MMVPIQVQSIESNRKPDVNKPLQQMFSCQFLLVLSICLSTVLGDGAQTGLCSYQYSNGDIVDLRSIGFDNGTARWTNLLDLGDPESPYHYSYNPCYGFNQGPDCQNVSACQEYEDSSGAFPIGDANSATFSEDVNLYITYKSQSDTLRTSSVQLVCDPDNTSPDLSVLRESPPGFFEMVLISNCCCPNTCTTSASSTQSLTTTTGDIPTAHTLKTIAPITTGKTAHTIQTIAPTKQPSDKLSAGSVLCIIFVCCVAAYVLFGALYMKLFVGASGKEIFPNFGFWNDFPHLIMDGFSFVFSPCTGNSSKGVYEDL